MWKNHKIKPFRPFIDMIYGGIPDATLQECVDALPERGKSRLLLGYYDESDIRKALEHFSIQKKLDELGLGNYRIYMNTSNPDFQELRFFVKEKNTREIILLKNSEPIAEIILREALLSPPTRFTVNTKPCPYLVVQWLRLQNPFAKFNPENLLPGQKFPGLGVGKKVMEMLHSLIKNLHLKGVVNRPEFLHNAILYSKTFKFVNPESQGRLNALKRDLKNLNLWQIAWAAHEGFIIENDNKKLSNWYQAEQVMDGCEHMEKYFQSKFYEKECKKIEEETHFSLSPDTPLKYRCSVI